jgi:beta-glucosidase
LWGKANFSGKLPITWPDPCSNTKPAFPPSGNVEFDVGYRYYEKNTITPRFYFGHGLSYATYTYAVPSTPCSGATKTGVITLNVNVTNTGTVDGDETVFAFAATTSRPIKELKGFTRAHIPAGQTKPVSVQVRAADLKYWNGNAWAVDSGNVDFYVGPSADMSKLQKVSVSIQ